MATAATRRHASNQPSIWRATSGRLEHVHGRAPQPNRSICARATRLTTALTRNLCKRERTSGWAKSHWAVPIPQPHPLHPCGLLSSLKSTQSKMSDDGPHQPLGHFFEGP
ncbi:unnamed protein product [Taenia asiatica]|uniref:Uncharacterized protein n=1 Tax=Taenia asiatica TaxID=60517 RepID=A0A0R3VSQ1_TAEAS|nr:unnamed protein product [Taenia asiatica]